MSLTAQCSSEPIEAIKILNSLKRFLGPSHQIILDLKSKLVIRSLSSGDPDEIRQAMTFCSDLLSVCHRVSPGRSRLFGILSSYFHTLQEKSPDEVILSSVQVMPKEEVVHMFARDDSFNPFEKVKLTNGSRSRSPGVL